MPKIRLFFPHVESGQISVGFSTMHIVNHIAEIDGAEVEAIRYWQQTASAIEIRDIPIGYTDSGDDLEIGV